jgi:chaperonin GroES
MVGQAFRKLLPISEHVLVEWNAAKTIIKRDIVLPEKSQGQVLQATVVAVLAVHCSLKQKVEIPPVR